MGNLRGEAVLGLLVAIFLASQTAMTDTSPDSKKTRVGIELAEERWVTLTDGSRVTQGTEISYLLADRLFNHPQFTPVLLTDDQPVALDLRIIPKVEVLLYASGSRSNRLVFGFAPDRENPFNAGKVGALDNEFVATMEEASQCVQPDFFEGRFATRGWGPFKSNFGANFDEGFIINIAGFGLGFKQKKFEIKNRIRFTVEDLKTGLSQDLVFDTKAFGKDVFVAGSYSGYSLGFEIQRRETLLEALKKILPLVVDGLVTQGFGTLEQKTVPERIFNQEFEMKMPHESRAQQQTQAINACLNKPGNWIEDTVEGLFSLYALWRYKNILDQPLKDKIKPEGESLRVVVLDSGIDYNDKNIGRHALRVAPGEALGFDFLAWDHRSSDDNGHGTAAAKYMLKTVKEKFTFISAKVIGAHGETHSAAVYDGFSYAVTQKADAIVVPWAPQRKLLEAYVRGARLAAQAGIAVFVAPGSMDSEDRIYVPVKNASAPFKVKGLGGTRLQLPADGVAVIDEFNRWLQNKRGEDHE